MLSWGITNKPKGGFMKLLLTDEMGYTATYTYPSTDFKALKKELNRWLRSHEEIETPLEKVVIDFTEDL